MTNTREKFHFKLPSNYMTISLTETLLDTTNGNEEVIQRNGSHVISSVHTPF